jgi:hypothetical protein
MGVHGRRMSRHRWSITPVVIAVLASGCLGSIDRDQFADEYQRRGGGLSGDRVVEVAASIERRVAPADLIVRSVNLTHLSVVFTVSTSDHPRETDTWTWTPRALRDPNPSRTLSDADDLRRSIRVESLDAEIIERAIDTAVVRSDLRGAYASSAMLVGTDDGGFRGTVVITNDRDTETWSFDAGAIPTKVGS